ncbi:hypothetical protein HYPSUDRAFT_65236 [Hypholoma sublateritium FD-334 SS-4]|uniref:Zn(2)-C6 fungal-type domain-containing protein n=1 Tax=Hypholoma sublateritium (strain FD-334 SS-4) TaxID=945553 RepID=A0A0D2P1V8_HYPSF|nr:hypothetical protein HYPSUDRAFT_65236 [Hypholoma sublateritium FD-334 SS-4]
MSSSTSTDQRQYQFDGPKTPKRTPMACVFCRGRKLKCDGNKPLCSNCDRRGLACSYSPVSPDEKK